MLQSLSHKRLTDPSADDSSHCVFRPFIPVQVRSTSSVVIGHDGNDTSSTFDFSGSKLLCVHDWIHAGRRPEHCHVLSLVCPR